MGVVRVTTNHDCPVELLASLGVGGVEVDAVEASVDGGFPEAGDTQHGALGGGEQDLRLSMHGALFRERGRDGHHRGGGPYLSKRGHRQRVGERDKHEVDGEHEWSV